MRWWVCQTKSSPNQKKRRGNSEQEKRIAEVWKPAIQTSTKSTLFRKIIPKPRNPRRKQSLVLSRWLAFESRGDPVSSHEKFDQVSGWNTPRATGNFFWKSFQCKISGFFQVILTRKYKKDFKWKDPKKFFLECMSLNHSVFLGRLQLHPKKITTFGGAKTPVMVGAASATARGTISTCAQVTLDAKNKSTISNNPFPMGDSYGWFVIIPVVTG